MRAAQGDDCSPKDRRGRAACPFKSRYTIAMLRLGLLANAKRGFTLESFAATVPPRMQLSDQKARLKGWLRGRGSWPNKAGSV
jgi:hypothetical protein